MECPLPIYTRSCKRGGSEIPPFSRNGVVLLFSYPSFPNRGVSHIRPFLHLLFSPIRDVRNIFRSSNRCIGSSRDHPFSIPHVTEANQGSDIFLHFTRSDPLPPAPSRLHYGHTSSAWTTAGYRKTHEIRLEGVEISVSPTTSAVNTRDTPPVLGETSSRQASYLPGLSHRLRSRTLLSLSASSQCIPPPERS